MSIEDLAKEVISHKLTPVRLTDPKRRLVMLSNHGVALARFAAKAAKLDDIDRAPGIFDYA